MPPEKSGGIFCLMHGFLDRTVFVHAVRRNSTVRKNSLPRFFAAG